ncbi:putative glutamamyl carboxypeptidase [Leptomonas seymouri]|uniref:Putative glutamamyl carboxypeptidase n=1 Tax=Leptomonas seymouri TaxID=5684 RepID=A0A0N1PB15_LEPSE|nr:putative glutamamyl carboxypeptidase [Leptomonas seymouri]|eukprot:KPI82841.1 putative glutamamyl carboxypeptidase [Leptomonas seymouri]
MTLMNACCNTIEYAAQMATKIRELALAIKKSDVQDKTYGCPLACVSKGVIEGGEAVNTVSVECGLRSAYVSRMVRRPAPLKLLVGPCIQEIVLPYMNEEYSEASVEVISGVSYSALNIDESDPSMKQSWRFCRNREVRKIGCDMEAGCFRNVLGNSTVIAGPRPSEVAHLSNEYVTIAEMSQRSIFAMNLVKLHTYSSFASKH